MTETRKRAHFLYIDCLNVTACFCVIWMHCNGLVHSFANSVVWKESLIVETIAYWAVPVFFMITGATLMDYRDRYSTVTYLKKRIEKTVLPFVIWSIINILYKSWRGDLDLSTLNPKTFFDMFINTKFEAVYWFFIPLFAVYLSIPVLSLLKKNKKILIYTVVLGLLTYSFLPTMFAILRVPYNSALSFPITGGYILFVLIGFLLADTNIEQKYRILFYVLAVFGILVRYCSTYIWSIRSGVLNKTFWGYLNFPSVFLACGVFVAFKYFPWNKLLEKYETIKKILEKVSGASFGIYLVHIMVMNQIIEWLNVDIARRAWRIGGAIIVYLISLIIVLMMKKIPILKRIVP
ncbi:acyltransferase [Lachnoclostridium sp. An181]|uniref:acyltransferase n=1 Tax=Lachnoclostridium sp. An181 TaxID=1965575 RepID=UPI000B3ADB80|nr:acyltransferase family protein [Lachnoclostridium sp. An181]OUP49755.1 hypothetical protein B5F18_07000 [Lachnoclostridium sp. An181]